MKRMRLAISLAKIGIGEKYGDMTVLSIDSRKSPTTGWNIPLFTVKCDVCGITRTTDAKALANGDGNKHGRGCAKAAVEQADQMIGKVYGDMRIVGKNFYVQPKGKPENKFIVRCEKCHHDHETVIGPLLSGEKCYHEDFCVPQKSINPRAFVGTRVDDMSIQALCNNRFHVKCNICGKERDVLVFAITHHQGTKHGNACTYGSENKYDHLIGTINGDMQAVEFFKRDAWWYARCKCRKCGKINEIRYDHWVGNQCNTCEQVCQYQDPQRHTDLLGTKVGDMRVIGLRRGTDCHWVIRVRCEHINADGTMCKHEKDMRYDTFAAKVGITHDTCNYGAYPSRIRSIYQGILQRCNNPKCASYPDYGGRGITCVWGSVDDFAFDMLESYKEACKTLKEENVSIERIDVNGNYCKENCKWIPIWEQAWNKRNTIYFTATNMYGSQYYGRCLRKFCQEHNLEYNKTNVLRYKPEVYIGTWRIQKISRADYENYCKSHQSDFEHAIWDCINKAYLRESGNPNTWYDRGIRVNFLEVCCQSHIDVLDPFLENVCSVENPYHLDISYDLKEKCFWVNMPEDTVKDAA